MNTPDPRRYAIATLDAKGHTPQEQAKADILEAGLEVRSYRVGVDVGEPHFSFNAVRFATEAEADRAGSDLLSRWFVARDYLVLPSPDAPNYAIVDGALKSV